MTRLSIPLSTDATFSDRELDWDPVRASWRVSEKEYGSVRWHLDNEPSPRDMAELHAFFDLPQSVAATGLRDLSPPELVRLHEASQTGVRIRIALCDRCGNHWALSKLEGDSWVEYGRPCQASRAQ